MTVDFLGCHNHSPPISLKGILVFYSYCLIVCHFLCLFKRLLLLLLSCLSFEKSNLNHRSSLSIETTHLLSSKKPQKSFSRTWWGGGWWGRRWWGVVGGGGKWRKTVVGGGLDGRRWLETVGTFSLSCSKQGLTPSFLRRHHCRRHY
ncbi:hypothetical protein HanIR_Chr12g0585971 [Helianthus annuus]|nr:hypothetical protein HanIR_Chr12g0585971 [Helianthus annuus]